MKILPSDNPLVISKLQPVDTSKVQIGGLLGQRLELTRKGNLLKLDWERDFLKPFREQQSAVGSYVGLGKTLDGLIHFAYQADDAELLALKERVVSELISTQLKDGYIGLYAPADRLTFCWDTHEMSYILFALVSDWRYFAAADSLQAARQLGDYLIANLTRESMQASEPTLSKTLVYIGFDRALLALYRVTKDQRYLDFCVQEIDLPHWNLPIVEHRHGMIEGHAYAFLTRALAQVELYELTGDDKLLVQTQRVFDYLRKEHGLVISGTSTIEECWHSDQTGCGHLGETCATAYLIRLSEQLLRLGGEGTYADLMERSIYNSLFGAQSPDGRQLRYYVPFEGPRVYWDLDTYCCPGNFRRIMSELPEMIYYTRDDGLVISLYTESKLKIELSPGLILKLHQETKYPASGAVTLYIELSRPAHFAFSLRRPAWCEEFTLSVNGEATEAIEQEGFLSITREWKSGDTLSFVMAMPPVLVRGIAAQTGRAALLTGPMVYLLNPKMNPQLAGVDLKGIVIDGTIEGPIDDRHLHSDGTAYCVHSLEPQGQILLTEFADPGGVASYFKTGPNVELTEDCLLNQ